MVALGADKGSTSGFERRGAVFRNVVIICSLLTGCLRVATNLIWNLVLPGYLEGDWQWGLIHSLVPLVLLAVVQLLPRGAWRWVGLGALVFAGAWALVFLVYLPDLPGLFAGGKDYALLLLSLASFLMLSSFLTATLSWLFLGLYCRGWAREFAAAKQASSAGAGNQESAQKETV